MTATIRHALVGVALMALAGCSATTATGTGQAVAPTEATSAPAVTAPPSAPTSPTPTSEPSRQPDPTPAPAASASPTTSPAPPPDDDAAGLITIDDFAFDVPATVAAGATIEVRNDDGLLHTITADAGAFDEFVDSGATAMIIAPDQPGDYDFFCQLHSGMQAVLTVG